MATEEFGPAYTDEEMKSPVGWLSFLPIFPMLPGRCVLGTCLSPAPMTSAILGGVLLDIVAKARALGEARALSCAERRLTAHRKADLGLETLPRPAKGDRRRSPPNESPIA
jgi:hypothetical protein